MRDAVAPEPGDAPTPRGEFSRRGLLAATVAGAALAAGGHAAARHAEWGQTAATFIGRAATYDTDLDRVVRDGLAAAGLDAARVRGRSVVLKPNLVEPSRGAGHINTHPAVVRAAAVAFRRLGAAEVVVAEGQGHVRDTDYALEQSGLAEVLRAERLPFVDLNLDEVDAAPNRLGQSALGRLWLPRTITRRADLVVSLPKLKTHHLAGVTLSLKNLFGVMPGACYGWPKNALHQAGLVESILDIAAAVRPGLAIVDGVVGMQGDGPIMGTPAAAGVLLIGASLPAVDATGARLMGIEPARVAYLARASGRLGPIREAHITQRGEPIAACRSEFAVLDHPLLRGLAGSYAGPAAPADRDPKPTGWMP